jgi:predicted permease
MFRRLDIFRLRLRSLLQKKRVEEDLDREMLFHLDRQIAENIASGMPPEDARRAAVRGLDGITRIKEECRDMRRTDWIDDFLYDLRHAVRTLANGPGFATVIVLTLALAIGANTAIFSVVNGVLLRRLPYPDQDRLVRFFMTNAAYPKFPINPWDFVDFRARNRSFQSMAIMSRADAQLSGVGEPVRLTGFLVSGAYFRVLGIGPERGREFDFRDELPGSGHVAILSDRIWRGLFHADPNILGQTVWLEQQPYTVVGVMPADMQHPGNEYRAVPYGDTVDVWRPFTFQGNPNGRGSHYTEGIARLKSGVSRQSADSEMNAMMAQLGREHPDNDAGWHIMVVPIYREIVGTSERMLLVLLGAVALVLLIACANAANLSLARATSRRREMAMRLALGAKRSRLVRQMLTESVLISIAGGLAGSALAVGGIKVLVSLLPGGFPRAHDIHLNLGVFAFAVAVTIGSGILFGLAPALQSSGVDLQESLREGARGASGSTRHLRWRNALVVSELSLACVLLAGAGLLLRSFVNLLLTDPGFRSEHVLTAVVSLPGDTYKNHASVSRFYDQLVARLSMMPGVRSAGIGSDLPWTGYDDNLGGFQIEGKQHPPNEEFHARYHAATPDYFRALGIPLIRGRFFADSDAEKAPRVLIINQAMAGKYWPGEDVIGKRIDFFADHPKESDSTRIVGVVGDVKDTPEKSAAQPAFWWPVAQVSFPAQEAAIAIRSDLVPTSLTNSVRNAVRELDPALPVANVRVMDEIADASVSAPRFTLFLVALFAALAIALAGIGTYGVISYSVNQRMQEFGIRIALGASRRDLLRLVLVRGLSLAFSGVVVGITGAMPLARLLRTMLYQVSAADPLTFSAIAVFALAIAALACYLPARRATKVDAMLSLRAE